jgi:tetratricopeptide (TPR) repeat protein
MGTSKKILPSIAILLLLLLAEGRVVTAAKITKINGLADSQEQNKILEGQINTSIGSDNQAKLMSNLAVELKNSGNSQDALKLFDQAIAIANKISDTSSKITIFSEIAVKLAQAGQQKRSLQIFDSSIKLAQKTNQDFSEYDKDNALQDIYIKIAQAGFIDKALDSGRKLSSNLTKAKFFNEVSTILLERGQRQRATQVLQQALQYVQRVTEKDNYAYEANGSCANYKFEVLSKIATNLSLQAQLDKGLQIAQNISACSSANGEYTQDYQAWAFLGILNHLKKVEAIKQTWNTAQKISFTHEKLTTWSAIAMKMADIGETQFALSIAKKLADEIPPITQIDSGLSMSTFFARENALADIAIALAKKQQFDAAMQISQTMIENNQAIPERVREFISLPVPSPKSTVLIEITQQLVAAKKVSQALQLANNLPDDTAKILAQIAVAQELQKNGQKTQAAQIFQNLSLPKSPAKANSSQGYEAHSSVAVALVKAKQIDKAIQVVNSIQDSLTKESILTNIAIQLADVGEIEKALSLVKNLEGEGSKASVNNKVVAKLIEVGQLEQALQITTSLKEPDNELIGKLAEKIAASGKKEQAIKIAESINGEELKARTLAAIALGFSF